MYNFNGRHLVEHESVHIVILKLLEDIASALQNLLCQTTCESPEVGTLALNFNLSRCYVLVNPNFCLYIIGIPSILDQITDLFARLCKTRLVASDSIEVGKAEYILECFDDGRIVSWDSTTTQAFERVWLLHRFADDF